MGARGKACEAVVAGHICLDIIPDLAGMRIATPAEFLVPGKLLVTPPARLSTGGAVSNTGLSLVKMGIRTALMGKVGRDPLGAVVRLLLRQDWGVTEGMLEDESASTSHTVVLAPDSLDRMFLHNPGANDTFCARDIDYDLVGRARLFHLGYPPLMQRLFERDGAETIEILRRVKALGVTTSLDMSLPDPGSPSGRVNWRKVLEGALPHVDLFLPSAEEVLFMLDRERFLQWRAESARGVLDRLGGDELHAMAEELLGFGARIVGIKCGEHGLYVRTAGAARLADIGRAKPNPAGGFEDRELWVPAFRIEGPPSATGAGDALIAGFLAAYLRGLNLEDCTRYAVAEGAANVMQPDALSGVLAWDALEARLAEGWESRPLTVRGTGWRRDPGQPRWLGPSERRPVEMRPDR